MPGCSRPLIVHISLKPSGISAASAAGVPGENVQPFRSISSLRKEGSMRCPQNRTFFGAVRALQRESELIEYPEQPVRAFFLCPPKSIGCCLYDRHSDDKSFSEEGIDFLTQLAAKAVEVKRAVVEEDERESGRRQLLNFGHTIAHAIEKCSDYSISHGHAVAIGMTIVSAVHRSWFLSMHLAAHCIVFSASSPHVMNCCSLQIAVCTSGAAGARFFSLPNSVNCAISSAESPAEEILAGLGEMYVTDERFRENIDKVGGEGTAAFVSKAIAVYCKK